MTSERHSKLSESLMHQGGRAMDAFLEAFFAIDTDNREVISIEDLNQYHVENDLDDAFPNTFMRLFHGENSGTITLEQYCKALGLVPKQAREVRQRRATLLLEQFMPSDLEIIYDDIKSEIKLRIVQTFLNELRESGVKPNIDMDRLDAAMQKLKTYLETVHGKPWHIIVSINQHLARFSYVPGCMLHFCLGRFAVLIWKTPYPD